MSDIKSKAVETAEHAENVVAETAAADQVKVVAIKAKDAIKANDPVALGPPPPAPDKVPDAKQATGEITASADKPIAGN